MMAITATKYTIRNLEKRLEAQQKAIMRHIVRQMAYIGEQCVKIARENGAYNDITGNLRSSIGYIVLVDGKPVVYGQPRKFGGKKGNGDAGPPAAKTLLASLRAKFPWGVTLIVCAGMQYASYVEAIHHKDVLSSAELEAERLAEKLLGGIVKSDDKD